MELHSLNALRNMEVIDILTGTKMGFIKDFKIDCNENKIVSLILPGEIKTWFAKEEETEISWKDIIKIGKDVILISSKEEVNANNM